MKKIIFFFILALGFISCQKENVEPNPQPNANNGLSTYTQYIVRFDPSMATIDSVKFNNITDGTIEVVTANNTSIICSSNNYNVSRFPLANYPVVDDVCEVTIYHQPLFAFGVPISNTVGVDTTNTCDVGGWSGDQLNSGTTTIINFTVE